MTNLDAADMTKSEVFFAAYEKAKSLKTEKQAINTAPIRIDEQVERFSRTTFSEADERILYEDAISV